MKIASSNVNMAASRTYQQQYERTENLRFWVGSQRLNFENKSNRSGPIDQVKAYILDLTDKAKFSLQEKIRFDLRRQKKAASTNPVDDKANIELTDEIKLKVHLVEKMVEMFTGKKIKIRIPTIPKDTSPCAESKELLTLDSAQTVPSPKGWGLEYDFYELYTETEKTTFSAEGIIKTADGKEINFSVDLMMRRRFIQEQNIHIRAGDAVTTDPLVINFEGTAAQLTQTKFSFDLNCDGTKDSVSFAGPQSGFLALDLNDDGIINNGTELFGPQTGNGFTELAGYDHDNNGWIDENDSIYQNLRIWTKDVDGNNHLFALGEKGIGAIYLGNVATQFAVKDTVNNLDGEVKSTGLFVRENGSVGTVQQIDLAL